jgi:transcription elongation factor Elf1
MTESLRCGKCNNESAFLLTVKVSEGQSLAVCESCKDNMTNFETAKSNQVDYNPADIRRIG